MGRKSKLSDAQWKRIEERLLNGEAGNALAKEFGIAPSTLREKTAHLKIIKESVNQIVTAESKIQALPISAQITAHSYAARLRQISSGILETAANGVRTSTKLSRLAADAAEEMESFNPDIEADVTRVKTISALTRLSNEAASVGMDLMKANKESMSDPDESNNKQPEMILLVAPEANDDHGEDRATTEADTGI
jgi:hypothetical protein